MPQDSINRKGGSQKMSFLGGRIAAGKEGAYFFQESKQAVGKLVEKSLASKKHPVAVEAVPSPEHQSQADVLPEVLRHSLPSKVFKYEQAPPPHSTTPFSPSKWVLPSHSTNVSSVSPDALNPLRAYLSLPQVTFGPKRWQLPSMEHELSASTANELRRDRHTPANPEKLKAAAEGLANVGKAFAVATAAVFGGTTLMFGMAASKLELYNIDDIKKKGKGLLEPKFDNIREQVVPLKIWVENMSRKWHLERAEDIKQSPLIQELSKILGSKP